MKRSEMEVLLQAMLTGDVSGAIMDQEKRGQGDLNANDVLPKECIGCTRQQLEQLGIVFGKEVDELFIEAKLPTGWSKRGTSHSMHSDLLDDKGRARAGIFYKAAFYDRKAHIGLNRRYGYHCQPVTGWGDDYVRGETNFYGAVVDCGKVIWHTSEEAKDGDYAAQEKLEKQAEAWITEHYPDYKNPLAYWD